MHVPIMLIFLLQHLGILEGGGGGGGGGTHPLPLTNHETMTYVYTANFDYNVFNLDVYFRFTTLIDRGATALLVAAVKR